MLRRGHQTVALVSVYAQRQAGHRLGDDAHTGIDRRRVERSVLIDRRTGRGSPGEHERRGGQSVLRRSF